MSASSKYILVLCVLLSLLFSACAGGFLRTKDFEQPYTFAIDEEAKISRTDQNKEILDTLKTYRDAVVARDVATLQSMVSKDYYENGSTTDDLSDDYGPERIDEILNDYFAESVRDVRFVIQVKQLVQDGEEFYVDFQYIWNFRFEVAGQSYWQSKNDVNRVVFVREDDA